MRHLSVFLLALGFVGIFGDRLSAQASEELQIVSGLPESDIEQAFTETLLSELKGIGLSVNNEIERVPFGDEGRLREITSISGRLVIRGHDFRLTENVTPATALLLSFGVYDDFDHARAVMSGPLADVARQEVADDRQLSLMLWPYASQALVAKDPFLSVDDLGVRSALVSNDFEASYFKALGAETALRQIDGIAVASAGEIPAMTVVEPSQLEEILIEGVELSTIVPFQSVFAASVVVSTEWWNSLSAKTQSGIFRALDSAEQDAARLHLDGLAKLSELARASGAEVVPWGVVRSELSNQAAQSAVFDLNVSDPGSLPFYMELAQFSRDESLLEPRRESPDRVQPVPQSGKPRVFFATDRRFVSGTPDLVQRFDNFEDPDATIRCGEVDNAALDEADNVDLDVRLKAGTEILEGMQCLSPIKEAIKQGSGRLHLHIHGFRNTFETALKRAVVFSANTDLQDTVLLWSWPSRGRAALYFDDLEISGWSEAQLQALIGEIAAVDGFSGLDIFAHSMGSRLAANTMRDAWPGSDGAIVFAAADLNRAVLTQAVQAAPKADVTVVATTSDWALWAASQARMSERVGYIPPHFYMSSVDTIDVSAFDSALFDFWRFRLNYNHGHAFEVVEVLRDLGYLFSGRWSAEDRGLERQSISPQGHYFVIR